MKRDNKVFDIIFLTIIILATMAFAIGLFSLTIAQCAELQRYDNYTQSYGDSLQPDGDRLQVIEGYVPEYGDYYEQDANGNLQHYDNYTPDYGHELRPENGGLQEYQDYVPDYGDYYE